MATDMRERLQRRILELAARLSVDEDTVSDESTRWNRTSADLNERFNRSLQSINAPLSSMRMLALAGTAGRGRSTLLRNRMGYSSPRGNVVTEPDRMHGLGLLSLSVAASDGGEYSREYRLENMLEQNTATYCSAKSSNIVVILEHASAASFVVTHAVMRSPPRGSFTAPVQDAIVFISDRPMDVDDFVEYDDYALVNYNNLLARKAALGESLNEGEPAAFLSVADADSDGTVTAKLSVPRTGRYIAIKFLRAVGPNNTNIDCEFIGFKGFTGARGFACGTLR
eukprot:m.172269 g.172269  ORF g.172269 m.172269 type:complete len:283 (+) comp13495_c0_seq1:82-930(+)